MKLLIKIIIFNINNKNKFFSSEKCNNYYIKIFALFLVTTIIYLSQVKMSLKHGKNCLEDSSNCHTEKKLFILPLNKYNNFLLQFNNNLNMDFKIEQKEYNNKKRLLEGKKIEDPESIYPYIVPNNLIDVYFYELNQLSLDYIKYLKYIPSNIKKVEFIYTNYSFYLESIFHEGGKDICDIIYEIYNHEKVGFTFSILHIINKYRNTQPTFYFNYYELYEMKYDSEIQKNMILNEFIRISKNYEEFSIMINYFEEKIANEEQIFLKVNFFKLIEYIEESLMIIKNSKKYEKVNIVIDDYYLNPYNFQNYFTFYLTKNSKEQKAFFIIKFILKLDGHYILKSLEYFEQKIIEPRLIYDTFYRMTRDTFYLPRNLEKMEVSCFNEKIQKLIDDLGNNYVDLFKFKNEIDLYIEEIINYDELTNIIINTYRYEFRVLFYNTMLYNYFPNVIGDNIDYVDYNEKSVYLPYLLPISYLDINFSEKKIHIMGPLYNKIINKIILEEKDYENILSYNRNFIKLGLSLENYLKSIFEYRTINLYKSNYNKYFMKGKEIKNPSSLNWNYIHNKSLNSDKNNLFVIVQENINGKFFDLLLIITNKNNNKIFCILFFIQISSKKSIYKLNEIIDNIYNVVDEYKSVIKRNNLEYDSSYFYLISFLNEIDKELFSYCFKANMNINIAFNERESKFYYFNSPPSYTYQILEKFPIEQNIENLVSNYLKYKIFKKPNDSLKFSEKQLLKFSQYYNQINKFNINFNSKIIKNKFGSNINIKYLVELDYDQTYELKNDIIGIYEFYTLSEPSINNKRKPKIRNKKKNNEKKYLGKKRISLIQIKRKQIYWINNYIIDENNQKIKCDQKFLIFKITQKQLNN